MTEEFKVVLYLQPGNEFLAKRNDISYAEITVLGWEHLTHDIRSVIAGKLELVTSKGTLKKDNLWEVSDRDIKSGHIRKVEITPTKIIKDWKDWGLSSTFIEFDPNLLIPFNTERLQTCKCLYEHHTGEARTKNCLKRCQAQINSSNERHTLKNSEKLVKEELTIEELKQRLDHIENVVKDYNGQKRRYYRMKTPPSQWDLLIKEAATVLFPDMKVEDPTVVEWILEFYPVEKKIEVWEDGTAWVRTILV